MSDHSAASGDLSAALAVIERLTDRFVEGLHGRILALSGVPVEFDGLRAALAAASTSVLDLGMRIVLVVVLVVAAFIFFDRQFSQREVPVGAWRGAFSTVASAVAALVVGFVAAWLLARSSLPLRTLRIWSIAAVGGCVAKVAVRAMLLQSRRPIICRRPTHLMGLTRDLSFAIGWAVIGLALAATLRLYNAGPGLTDLIVTGLFAVPTFLFVTRVMWRYKRTMAGAVAGPRPRNPWWGSFARSWPKIVIGLLGAVILNAQIDLTLGAALPHLAVLASALIFIFAPHLDAMIWNWAQRGLESPDISIPATAWRQTSRLTVLVIMIATLGALWAAPLATGFGIDLTSVARDALEGAIIALSAAFLWNVIGTITSRTMRLELRDLATHKQGAPRSRLGTLVPLLGIIGKSSIFALAALSILVSIGVNVWPVVTGLSVFGLAIGFGSQTLVKDIVSGLFFLIDDAFRFGEYIEASGAKGTVEKISIRSVALRDSSGSVATVPYGQIGSILNFSRDWAVETLTFRVAFDTDMELVRNLLEQIGQDIAKDPELAPGLLEPFQSQGIADVEQGSLVVRAKFTAKPGRQSKIRQAALTAVHSAFRENGIQTTPNLMTGRASRTRRTAVAVQPAKKGG